MTKTPRAAFLSYASQDAEAARRICDALRSGGIEVWFDQSELRGVDTWDQMIRRQIHECALFVPVISASTQGRSEGYFRLEWRLADQRTHQMGRSRVFVMPVCIDDTRDADADIPDSFSAVQWTRLPAGNTPPAFVERVARLLLHDNLDARSTALPAAGSSTITPQAVVPAHVPSPEKSIAVLPFANLSADNDREYFSDGLAEEILNALSQVEGLRVASRSSSFSVRVSRLRSARSRRSCMSRTCSKGAFGALASGSRAAQGHLRRSPNTIDHQH